MGHLVADLEMGDAVVPATSSSGEEDHLDLGDLG